MKRTLKAINAFVMIAVFSSCASIVSKTQYEVRVNSSPADAVVTIYNRSGLEIHRGKTPFQIRLKSGAGYFKKAVYEIEFSKPGYADRKITLNSDINGWYFGNIVFGGLIGFLIVDPATGAMYKLNRTDITETLAPATTGGGINSNASLQIYDIADVPAGWKDKLTRLKEK